MRWRQLRLVVGVACVAGTLLTAQPAAAIDANLGYSRLSYVCSSPTQINFSWTAATNAAFYSFQLFGPVDPAVNGGVTGTYLRQFGSLEIQKGTATTATVTLAGLPPAPITLQWQVMVGGSHGYSGYRPRQQVALVDVPCTATSQQDSPFQ